MGSNKLDTGGNESLFTTLLQENDFSLPFWQNAAADTTGIFQNDCSAIADPTPFTDTPLQIAPPWKQMHVPYQPNTHDIPETCGNLMVDLNQLHNFQKPMIDPNSLTEGTNIPCMYGRDLQYPEGNVKGVSRMHDVMNGSVHFNSSQDPGINKRIPLIRSNIGRGYEMQGGQADISNISGPQIQNFVGSGGSSISTTPNSDGPLINNFVGSGVGRTYNTQNSEAIGIRNNGELCIRRFGCPTKVDGSFLSLAIGNNTNVKAKSDHSGAITGGGLYGAVAPQLNTSCALQDSGSSFDLGCNSIGGLSSFQNNVGGFTGLGDHVGGWTSSYNNVGVRDGISTTTNSSLFCNVQKPQANMQHGFPSGTRDLGIVDDKNARYPSLDSYKGFIGPCSSTSTKLPDSGQTAASGLASESAKLSWTAQPNCDQLQKHLENTVQNLSPESSRASSFIRFKESFTRQEHSGQLFPASKDGSAQAVDGNAQPRRHVQPAGLFSVNDTAARYGAGGGVFPKRVGFQVSKDSAAQAAGSGLFPRRLGVQINEYRAAPVAGDGLFQRSRGIKSSKSHVAYAPKCGQYAKEIEVQTATKGQPFPTSNGSGLSQASDVLGVPLPSLKRRAMHPPPAAPRVQRRKITLPPPIHPYMPFSQTAPAPLPHIQWKGLDGLPQPTEQKCMLCKRDLSFSPEGPVQQPAVPPAVAVLPCGHTFHDHCLQTITPEDQSKDPPCIPCAIGET